MRVYFLGAFLAIVITTAAIAEIVQTTDGRTVDLRDDGTYGILEAPQQRDADFVEYQEHFLVHHAGDYGIKRIHFMPIYKNISDKKIVGVKFNVRFLNAFGEEVWKSSGELDESVGPGEISSRNIFFYLEDNPFIKDEPYDKLMSLVTNKTGSMDVTFTMIVFEGGEIVNLVQNPQ